MKGKGQVNKVGTNLNALFFSRLCEPQSGPRCTRHTTSQAAILFLSLNDETVQGVILAICRFCTLNVATRHLIICCTSCTVKLSWGEEMGQNVCQCVCACLCASMSCLFFAGDSPSSLADIQDLFSPSLYITANGITEALCPVLSLSPPPPVPYATSCFFPFPILQLAECVGDLTLRGYLVLL